MGTLDHVGMQCGAMAASGAGRDGKPDVWIGEFNSGAGFGESQAFVRDPDGNTVEACCHLPESVRHTR